MVFDSSPQTIPYMPDERRSTHRYRLLASMATLGVQVRTEAKPKPSASGPLELRLKGEHIRIRQLGVTQVPAHSSYLPAAPTGPFSCHLILHSCLVEVRRFIEIVGFRSDAGLCCKTLPGCVAVRWPNSPVVL